MQDLWHRLQLVYWHSKKDSLADLLRPIINSGVISNEILLTLLERKYLPNAIENGQPVLCPVCNKPMKDTSWTQTGYDSDNEFFEHEEIVLKCTYCHVQKINDEWEIPEKYKASEKQIKTANFIEEISGIPAPPPTKKLLWIYINKNIEKAKQIQKKQFDDDSEDYGYDNIDYVPPYDELC